MCGIIAISNHPQSAELAKLGLFALQHRGQESAGIVTAADGELHSRVGMGLVSEVFPSRDLAGLPGRMAIGHVRYATTGASHLRNAQPLVFKNIHGPVAIAHNGNLTNALEIKNRLERRGAIFQSSTDSEVIIHLLARANGPLEDAAIDALRQVAGAYSLLFLTPSSIIAARDPYGFRPLLLGQLDKSWVVASETSALHLIKARVVREIEPGEMLIIEGERIKSLKPFKKPASPARCVFEQVYFARPDSTIFGRNVQASRRDLGRALARELSDLRADIVVPVPDSGISAALGFSDVSGIPFELGLVRSHYVSRTFIKPTQELRELAAELKLAPVPETLRGKSVILIDDSIVRGTTSKKIAKSLRRAGAREIHMAVSSPPIVSPCYYGIDTPRAGELVANEKSVEEVRRFLGVDSLHYLSLEGMLRACAGEGGDTRGYCTACFTKLYPTPISDYQTPEPRKKG
ncbi:MAG: amidophosphoribosyltransferase [Elusimicrobia bacterium]|nr:amidophosphoribosyltransferase [Elusimicrobiota bacterium]MDE2425197.1 amidophosphoribosyltransferase [Elusimicrobiota bacterium]